MAVAVLGMRVLGRTFLMFLVAYSKLKLCWRLDNSDNAFIV